MTLGPSTENAQGAQVDQVDLIGLDEMIDNVLLNIINTRMTREETTIAYMALSEVFDELDSSAVLDWVRLHPDEFLGASPFDLTEEIIREEVSLYYQRLQEA